MRARTVYVRTLYPFPLVCVKGEGGGGGGSSGYICVNIYKNMYICLYVYIFVCIHLCIYSVFIYFSSGCIRFPGFFFFFPCVCMYPHNPCIVLGVGGYACRGVVEVVGWVGG